MSNETNELMDYLFRIAKKSIAGEIPWDQPNPSTFQWVQRADGDIFLVTIQKSAAPIGARGLRSLAEARENLAYLFQVQNKANKQISISLLSKERPDVLEALAEIYHGAEKGMDVRATSILRKLLNE